MSHYRYSEDTFRSVEPLLIRIASRFPESSSLAPTTLACSTLKQRLADAINWIIANPATPTTLDIETVKRIKREFGIALDPNNTVYIGPRRYGKKLKSDNASMLGNEIEYSISEPVDCSDLNILNALVTLKSAQVISGPIEIINLNPSLIDSIESNHDLVIVQEPNRTLLL
jgi:hypothetical protein